MWLEKTINVLGGLTGRKKNWGEGGADAMIGVGAGSEAQKGKKKKFMDDRMLKKGHRRKNWSREGGEKGARGVRKQIHKERTSDTL